MDNTLLEEVRLLINDDDETTTLAKLLADDYSCGQPLITCDDVRHLSTLKVGETFIPQYWMHGSGGVTRLND